MCDVLSSFVARISRPSLPADDGGLPTFITHFMLLRYRTFLPLPICFQIKPIGSSTRNNDRSSVRQRIIFLCVSAEKSESYVETVILENTVCFTVST